MHKNNKKSFRIVRAANWQLRRNEIERFIKPIKLESDKLYYGEDVKARVTKTKALTMHELTENLEKAFASHKTDVPHMYKLNSSESVKILKTVFDVKTCKKLSFSKDSDSL